jgi:uracil-DNA glycosylase family 4
LRRTELRDPLWNAIASFGLKTLHFRGQSVRPGARGLAPEASTGTASSFAAPPAPRQGESAGALMRKILEETLDCRGCRLAETRTNLVFGEGNPGSRILFVGEGPGATEDETGRPFVGKAGQLLDRILAAIDIDRTKCYIANVVKCRPPANRVPASDEIAACSGILERQIEAIHPRVIVALGASAASALLECRQGLAALRGSFHSRRGIPLLVTYHPAALLRTPALKRPVWDDMKKLRSFLEGDGRQESSGNG